MHNYTSLQDFYFFPFVSNSSSLTISLCSVVTEWNCLSSCCVNKRWIRAHLLNAIAFFICFCGVHQWLVGHALAVVVQVPRFKDCFIWFSPFNFLLQKIYVLGAGLVPVACITFLIKTVFNWTKKEKGKKKGMFGNFLQFRLFHTFQKYLKNRFS